uniref:Uncharacterized protein n=1 Tax=Anguilla anguilla TaxID=7936 RepID=A0A0E9SV76_ANGAN
MSDTCSATQAWGHLHLHLLLFYLPITCNKKTNKIRICTEGLQQGEKCK